MTFNKMVAWRMQPLLVCVALLCGCATSGRPRHGVFLLNRGTTEVSNLDVRYGNRVVTVARRLPPNASSRVNAEMPVPDQMVVSWTTDGRDLRSVVPLKVHNRLDGTVQLRNWHVRFSGETLEVWREDSTGPLNSYTGLWPTRETKVYP